MKAIASIFAAAVAAAALGGTIDLMPANPSGKLGNLRNLKVAPEGRETGAKGQTSPFVGATFTYPLGAVFGDFSRGKLTVWTRTHRQFVHVAHSVRLHCAAHRAAPALAIGHVKGPRSEWQKQVIEWDATGARLTAGGQMRPLRAAPAGGWKFDSFDVCGYIADEIELELPEGTLRIDWENDFWAKVELTKSSAAAAPFVQVTGFDNFFVSEDPQNRDAPAMNVVNPGERDLAFAVDFEMTGELTGYREKWRRRVKVPARGSRMEIIEFPGSSSSDIYHLTAKSENGETLFRKHFMKAQKRGERKGSAKFGFHCGARDHRVCANPSALPLDYDHWYFSWAYVCVVPWAFGTKDGVIVDKNGTRWGEDPNRPADDWNWGTNESLVMGRKFLACINETPQAPWQRLGKIGTEWWQFGDIVGGEPNYEKLKEFTTEVVKRGGDNLMALEVSNEPNAGTLRHRPDIYAKVANAEAEAAHALRKDLPVFYISGTGPFEGYMEGVNKAGVKGIDGLSLHTYCGHPEDSTLAKRIVASRKMAAAAGAARYGNTETGVMGCGRDVPEKPLDAQYVKSRAAAGAKGFVAAGMNCNPEREAGAMIAKNAIVNFALGAEFFTYFGWNHGWIVDNWREKGEQMWTMISGTPGGEQAPTYFALAVGVQIEQMQGIIPERARMLDDAAVHGGYFPKANGGSMLALWGSHHSEGEVRITSASRRLEVVSMLGKRTALKSEGKSGGRHFYTLAVGDEPCYVHDAAPGVDVASGAILAVKTMPTDNTSGWLRIALRNPLSKPAKFEVAIEGEGFASDAVCSAAIGPGKSEFLLVPYDFIANRGVRGTDGKVKCRVRVNGKRYSATSFAMKTPPVVFVPRINVADPKRPIELAKSRSVHKIDSGRQVSIGAPDPLLSYADTNLWAGVGELSANVRFGYDDEYFYAAGSVTDANFRVPEKWPGKDGSTIQLSIDGRRGFEGAGQGGYANLGGHFSFCPVSGKAGAAKIQSRTRPDCAALGILASTERTKKGYRYMIAVPWKAIGRRPEDTIRADISFTAPKPGKAEIKSQISLFGDHRNETQTSRLAVLVMEPADSK